MEFPCDHVSNFTFSDMNEFLSLCFYQLSLKCLQHYSVQIDKNTQYTQVFSMVAQIDQKELKTLKTKSGNIQKRKLQETNIICFVKNPNEIYTL